MSFKSIILLLIIPLLNSIALPVTAQQKSRQQEKTELIQKAIRYAIEEHQDLPTYQMVKNRKKIYVLSQMKSLTYPDSVPDLITEAMLPDLGKTKLILLQEQDLPGYYLKKNDLYYIVIGKIDILTADAGVVDIGAKWILGKKSRRGGLRQREAGGYTLLFKREGTGWSEGKKIRTYLYE